MRLACLSSFSFSISTSLLFYFFFQHLLLLPFPQFSSFLCLPCFLRTSSSFFCWYSLPFLIVHLIFLVVVKVNPASLGNFLGSWNIFVIWRWGLFKIKERKKEKAFKKVGVVFSAKNKTAVMVTVWASKFLWRLLKWAQTSICKLVNVIQSSNILVKSNVCLTGQGGHLAVTFEITKRTRTWQGCQPIYYLFTSLWR